MNFESWLAKLLGQKKHEVQHLLADQTALHFLIAWSLLESKCFNGYVKVDHLDRFSKRIVEKESFDTATISKAASHFHARYQDKAKYKHLMYKQDSPKMTSILQQSFSSLQPYEMVFLVALTVYRFRNNIFHGNKGVDSWLNYKQQIDYCIDAMQAFINNAESINPSLLIA